MLIGTGIALVYRKIGKLAVTGSPRLLAMVTELTRLVGAGLQELNRKLDTILDVIATLRDLAALSRAVGDLHRKLDINLEALSAIRQTLRSILDNFKE